MGAGTSISLPLAIWGEGYSQFLAKWFEAVDGLETQPDEIIVVCDEANFPAVMQAVTNFELVTIKVERHDNYAGYWNRAIELCSSKWIAICNADDYFLPQALNEIAKADEEGCNLICDHLLHKHSNQRQSAVWNPDELGQAFRLMGANPMTKRLWEASGGFPVVRFADWGLALRMRKTGLVKAFYASTDRIVYDVGHSRSTMSGARLEANLRMEGNDQIKRIAQELG